MFFMCTIYMYILIYIYMFFIICFCCIFAGLIPAAAMPYIWEVHRLPLPPWKPPQNRRIPRSFLHTLPSRQHNQSLPPENQCKECRWHGPTDGGIQRRHQGHVGVCEAAGCAEQARCVLFEMQNANLSIHFVRE